MTKNIKADVAAFDRLVGASENFDVVRRDLILAERTAALFFVDGFLKDEVFEKVMEFLFKLKKSDIKHITDMQTFSTQFMPYVEAGWSADLQALATGLLSGVAVLFIEGFADALMIDARTYPVRSIEEPEKDKSLRGSRDSFVETLILNTAMVRRRIRDPRLRMEYHQIGTGSKVDVAISYIAGQTDEKVLQKLRQRLKGVRLNGISMTTQALTEALVPSFFLNPFPKIRFTERPDYASACILEGRIVLIMDNAPSVMIFATSLFDFSKEIDDYYFPPLTGTFVRTVRLFVSLLTVFLTPLALYFLERPWLLPRGWEFLQISQPVQLPLILQFLILELLIDGLRLASVNTPSSLSNSLGIIGGLLLSEFAIQVGWFSTESILYMSFVAITGYSQPSFEMGYAMKFGRTLLLILTHFWGLWGLGGGTLLLFGTILTTKTLSGRGYFYPVIPFNLKDFVRIFVRPRVKNPEK